MTSDIPPPGTVTCICQACGGRFFLYADSDSVLESRRDVAYLAMRGCESGGIYSIEAECPFCKHHHELR